MMRVGLGILILFCLVFAGVWPMSLFALIFLVSALVWFFEPESRWSLPGMVAAGLLGSVVVLVLVVNGLEGIFDGDC
jgi:hypothetical protein